MSAGYVNASTRSALVPPELLHVLMLPDFDRADRFGSYGGNPATRSFAELLIDCEQGPDAPATGHLPGQQREYEASLRHSIAG